MMVGLVQQLQQDQRPGAAAAQRAQAGGGDAATDAVAGLLKEAISSPETQQAILQELQDGARDLEMAMAEVAVNLLQSATNTVKSMRRAIPPQALSRVCAMVVAKLLEMAQSAQLLGDNEPKLLARRALALTVHMYRNGKGSVQ
ncbi:hypothetical protein GCM10007907_27970 [Chitinimonas prasina]|uniref:Uncharacterized protein n=1 Tax=Chitinimonas prasina TaxID=1434937 RepID=A0ABQ5YJZ3_9NEIS|nr:hypothetical protein [Chitinimonas prasina]GLR14007.1 hypothetical protein GCM10007907_27970 [Chitinimonas prasina]